MCEKDGEQKFYLVSGFENGRFIYSLSENEILNVKDNKINNSASGSKTEVFTYGDGKNFVTDTHDFRKVFLTNIMADGKSPAQTGTLGVGISVNPDWCDEGKLPKEYREETTEHKIALIKFHYNNIVAQYSNIEISDEDFKNVAIADNRVFKGEGNIINQYTLDESFKNNEQWY